MAKHRRRRWGAGGGWPPPPPAMERLAKIGHYRQKIYLKVGQDFHKQWIFYREAPLNLSPPYAHLAELALTFVVETVKLLTGRSGRPRCNLLTLIKDDLNLCHLIMNSAERA